LETAVIACKACKATTNEGWIVLNIVVVNSDGNSSVGRWMCDCESLADALIMKIPRVHVMKNNLLRYFQIAFIV